MLTKLKHLPYLLKCRRSGLKKLPKDTRDFEYEKLGALFGYKPKHTEKINKTISVKNQHNLSTCVFNAATVCKEPDENVVLSVRSLVAKAVSMGLVGKYGLSNLRTGQEVLRKWGIMEESDCPEMYDSMSTWNQYKNVKLDDKKASKHKTKSYWSVNSLNSVYKLLDEGKHLTTGMAWYSGFNEGGGFKLPWIIRKLVGWYVGGHSVALIGYIKKYNGMSVLVFQNSYSENWGDDGRFYVEEKYFENNIARKYGCYVNLDIPKDTASFIHTYNNKVVKGEMSNGVYKIEDGKKRPYISWDAFYSHNPLSANELKKIISIVSQADLDNVKEGEPLTVESSKHYEALKNLKKPFTILK